MSRTACAVPFAVLDIGTDGSPVICCQAPITLTVDGHPARIDRDSFPAIWNAPEIVALRGAMGRGEKPEACRTCWEHEAAGAMSLRLLMNDAVRYAIGGDWSLSKFVRDASKVDFNLATRPRWYQLQLGNTCNLKCRSCNPSSSSRIAADPVQRAWFPNDFHDGHLPPVIPRSAAWFRDPARVAEIVGEGDDDVYLSLLGGEPFLIDEVWGLLHLLVDSGVSKRITLGILTNGTHRRAELADLAPAFRSTQVSVSIDGYGSLFEYLRHGATWRELLRTLDWLQATPNVTVNVTPTLQNSNALGAVKLFRFLDERGLNVHFNILTEPARLSATNLPPRVRRIAARRLRSYLDDECRAGSRSTVQGWVTLLEEEHEFDPLLFQEFMEFTNDLDASRGQSLAAADPELFALLHASGVVWSRNARHTSLPVAPGRKTLRLNRTISPRDAIYALMQRSEPLYFASGMSVVNAIDALLLSHGHPGLEACHAIADFASHYGRITRVLQARLPHAVVYACDIDRNALDFCERELGAVPVETGWRPDEEEGLPRELDLIVCVSLLTHTPREHWRHTLRAWSSMLRAGGIVVFTYLSDAFVAQWRDGKYVDYGEYSSVQRDAAALEFAEDGFAFVPLAGPTYGDEPSYGVAFARSEVVREEVVAAGLELLELDAGDATFSQSVAVARKPGERGTTTPAPDGHREVRVVALYDPRGYEQSAGGESVWSQLVAARPARSLPSGLGYADPRVPEVREAQAELAREHGIDAFCYVYPWLSSGAQWDAPLRDLLASGRPDFPFCLMWVSEEREPVSVDDADGLLISLLPYLRDRRYLRHQQRPLVVVRDVAALADPRATAARWRALAEQHGIGEIHLCAVEPIPADSLDDLGFDSALELPATTPATPYEQLAAASLARPRPPHPLLRGVLCQREPSGAHNLEHYELWLRSTIETAGEAPVFLRSWNEWADGAYLEPDDRDGRDFLAATRRAVRGPASGLVLLRRLRDSLGNVDGKAAGFLAELAQVISVHERFPRDELTALVESAYATPQQESPGLRWVPVASSILPPAPGRVSIDRFGAAAGADVHDPDRSVILDGDSVTVQGWAQVDGVDPSLVDLFVVLTSVSNREERVFRLRERSLRPDVVAAFPDYPQRCGFAGMISIGDLSPGTYRVGIVQRTPAAAYYDASTLSVSRG